MSESLAHKILNNPGLSYLALQDEKIEIYSLVFGATKAKRERALARKARLENVRKFFGLENV